ATTETTREPGAAPARAAGTRRTTGCAWEPRGRTARAGAARLTGGGTRAAEAAESAAAHAAGHAEAARPALQGFLERLPRHTLAFQPQPLGEPIEDLPGFRVELPAGDLVPAPRQEVEQ